MFVQSARFVSEHQKNPAKELAIYGQEKERATGDLCRMNLAVHGLEGDIKQAISYYDDPHDATGRFDFVLANPPFNVNAVDKERLKDQVGAEPPVSLRSAAHRQRQLPLDSTLLLRAEGLQQAAEPDSSWPTPPPTPARPNRKSAANSSKAAPWT